MTEARWITRSDVVVDAEGILVRGLFDRRVPYERILSIHHAQPDADSAAFRVSIRLDTGAVVELKIRGQTPRKGGPAGGSASRSGDPVGSDLVQEIREHWFVRQQERRHAVGRAPNDRPRLPEALATLQAVERSGKKGDEP